MILGFLLAVCFNPYSFAAATQPRWAFLAITLPLLLIQAKPQPFTILHLIGALFLSWAIITLTWTANVMDGLGLLIQLAIVASAFLYGTRVEHLSPLMKGLALGLGISSLIVVVPWAQELFRGDLVSVSHEGLLGNRNLLGEAAVLVAVGCVVYRAYWYLPLLLPAIFITPLPRGALLGGLASLSAWAWGKNKLLLIPLGLVFCLGIGGSLLLAGKDISTLERWHIWEAVWRGLTFWGHGLGSLYTLSPFLTHDWDAVLVRTIHAHNDILEIWFDVGVIGTLLYSLWIAAALGMADAGDRGIIIAFLVIGLVGFPWFMPVTAFLAAVVLGHVARRGVSVRHHWLQLRMALYARDAHLRAGSRQHKAFA